MNSLVSKIVTWIGAIAIWWWGCQGGLAGTLSDAPGERLRHRIDRYPDWDSPPQLTQHQGELTYPEWFRGRWIATSTLLAQIAPLAPEIVTPGFESNRKYINQPIEFTVQFVPNDPDRTTKISPLNLPRIKSHSIEPKIVADRAFNGLNIATAYLGTANIKSVKIDPENPTKQITQLTQDRQLETFVTGFDLEIPDADRFIATELAQQVFRTNSTIYLNTVETTTSYQFLPTPTPKITATQISAIYLSPQDPDYFRTLDRLTIDLRNHPVALYKYRLDLVRRP
jgi:hypothetical protein